MAMNFNEAKVFIKTAKEVFRAYITGSVWSAGAMREVDETIGYYATEAEALAACEDRKLFDFDPTHLSSEIEKMTTESFV